MLQPLKLSPVLVTLSLGAACVPSGNTNPIFRSGEDTGPVAQDAQNQAPHDTGVFVPPPRDSGFLDRGFVDTGASPPPRDAGPPDTGVPIDVGFAMDATVPQNCPPSGPFGTGVGDTLADLELPDCDGNMHRIHDLCGRKASWMFGMAGW